MVVVAQLVRALVCGTRGRGFEPHLPPKCLPLMMKILLTDLQLQLGNCLFFSAVTLRQFVQLPSYLFN